MRAFINCLLQGGHVYGAWRWLDYPEATNRVCECCSAMQKPTQRKSWLLREREITLEINRESVWKQEMLAYMHNALAGAADQKATWNAKAADRLHSLGGMMGHW